MKPESTFVSEIMLILSIPLSALRLFLRLSLLGSVLLVFYGCGCAVGPDYKRPEIEAPPRYRFDDIQGVDSADSAWWAQFGDQQLERLIAIALAENKDVLIAAARVEEFYGRYGVQRGQQFPQAGVQAQGGSQQASRVSTPPIPAPVSVTSDFYAVDLGVSFEIDLWGRLRRASEAARADLLAVEENRRTVILSLVSAVATAYVNLLDLDRQLEISRSTVQTRAESLRIFDLRFKGGTISEVELQQVRSEYEAALAAIPALEKQIAQQENNLAVLLGRNPGPLARGGTLDKLLLPAVPAGSAIGAARTPVRISASAEQQLVAANARIGVAKAAFYPSISLTGLLGVASADLSNLFTGDARTWTFAGLLSQPIFTGGTLAGQLAVSEAQQKQALYAYQQSIQTAFGEIENSLVDQAKTRRAGGGAGAAGGSAGPLRATSRGCVTRTATPATSKCSTRSGACSRRSSSSSRRRASSISRSSTSTRPWAAAGWTWPTDSRPRQR